MGLWEGRLGFSGVDEVGRTGGRGAGRLAADGVAYIDECISVWINRVPWMRQCMRHVGRARRLQLWCL